MQLAHNTSNSDKDCYCYDKAALCQHKRTETSRSLTIASAVKPEWYLYLTRHAKRIPLLMGPRDNNAVRRMRWTMRRGRTARRRATCLGRSSLILDSSFASTSSFCEFGILDMVARAEMARRQTEGYGHHGPARTCLGTLLQ